MATPEANAQLSREDLAGMTPEAIAEAYAQGRLNAALGRPVSVSEAISGLPQPEGA